MRDFIHDNDLLLHKILCSYTNYMIYEYKINKEDEEVNSEIVCSNNSKEDISNICFNYTNCCYLLNKEFSYIREHDNLIEILIDIIRSEKDTTILYKDLILWSEIGFDKLLLNKLDSIINSELKNSSLITYLCAVNEQLIRLYKDNISRSMFNVIKKKMYNTITWLSLITEHLNYIFYASEIIVNDKELYGDTDYNGEGRGNKTNKTIRVYGLSMDKMIDNIEPDRLSKHISDVFTKLKDLEENK